MNPAQTNHPEPSRDWLPRWFAERGFHSTGPGTFSNGRAQFQILGQQLTALPGNGTVAWRGDIPEADTATLQFLLQTLVDSPGFQSQTQIARRTARREHAAAALHLVTTTITEDPDSHASVHLRRFLWSLYNGHHALSLWRLRDNLDARHQGAVTLLFAAWMQGDLPDDTLRQALTDSGEMDRWDDLRLNPAQKALFTTATESVTQLLATLPPSGLYPDITRANALLRQVVDCLTPKR
jgi:hypothetical protein